MKIEFSRIRELLGTTEDITQAFGRVELPHPKLLLKNPHSPIEKDNLIDPSLWNVVEEFDRAGIHYRFRVEPLTTIAYLSISRTELMRIYSNRPIA